MNSDQLNRWLTLGANIAVLAGLVALVVEVRANTAAITAAAGWREDWQKHRKVLDPNFVALAENCP